MAAALPLGLKELDLSLTGCGDEGMVAMAAALPATLRKLTCYDNHAIGPAGWTALGDALPRLIQLKRLCAGVAGPATSAAGCSGMGCAGVKGLVARFSSAMTLGQLHLDSCCIGDEGAQALVAALPKLSDPRQLPRSARHVFLSGNEFGPASTAALESVVDGGIYRVAEPYGYRYDGLVIWVLEEGQRQPYLGQTSDEESEEEEPNGDSEGAAAAGGV